MKRLQELDLTVPFHAFLMEKVVIALYLKQPHFYLKSQKRNQQGGL